MHQGQCSFINYSEINVIVYIYRHLSVTESTDMITNVNSASSTNAITI